MGESALQTAKDDKELFLLHHVRNLFVNADTDRSGRITWPEFQKQVENPSMNMYFKAIDLDKEEARDLFRLIDIDESGTIDAEAREGHRPRHADARDEADEPQVA